MNKPADAARQPETPADPFGYASAPLPDAADLREAEVARARRKKRRRPVPCTATVAADGKVQFRSAVSDEAVFVNRLFDTCGSESGEWITCLSAQLAGASVGQVAGAGFAFLNGVAPADEVEAALAAQMFATHNLAMSSAAIATAAEPHALDRAVSLGQLFVAQVNALVQLQGRRAAPSP